MRTADEATEHTIKLGKQHVAEQETRIERQKQLIASLEVDGHAEAAQATRQLLKVMTDLLDRMHHDLAQTKDRLESRHAR